MAAQQDSSPSSRKGEWIKTSDGWRTCHTIVIINNQTGRTRTEWRRETAYKDTSHGFAWGTNAPFVVLPGYSTRGPVFYFLSGLNERPHSRQSTIGEAFQSLNLRSALKDSCKLGYVSKLLGLCIQNLAFPHDSTVYKQIFAALTEVVHQVLHREENLHIARHLLKLAKEHLIERKDEYIHYQNLWDGRTRLINDLQSRLQKFKVKKGFRISMKSPTLEDLPDECLRLILNRFCHHSDICHLAQVNRRFNKFCNENLLWRKLCQFHFSKSHLMKRDLNVKSDWQSIYRALIRKCPLREVYADMLVLCSHCYFVFWKYCGHICSYDSRNTQDKPPMYIPVTPKGFLHLFET